MTGHPPKLNHPRTTLRRGRALVRLLLRTACGTVILLGCGLSYLSVALRPAPAGAPAPAGTARRSALKPPHKTRPARGLEIADPLSLIKISKTGGSAGDKDSQPGSGARPRLKAVTFAGSGGRFNPLGQDEPQQAQDRTESAPRDREAVQLPASALSKKIKVKGARPVPVSVGKKYSGLDPEAEFLRERLRRQTAAAEDARLQLRAEKLALAGWLILLALAGMLIPSRVIKAWRLIQKPEGSHWTLK